MQPSSAVGHAVAGVSTRTVVPIKAGGFVGGRVIRHHKIHFTMKITRSSSRRASPRFAVPWVHLGIVERQAGHGIHFDVREPMPGKCRQRMQPDKRVSAGPIREEWSFAGSFYPLR